MYILFDWLGVKYWEVWSLSIGWKQPDEMCDKITAAKKICKQEKTCYIFGINPCKCARSFPHPCVWAVKSGIHFRPICMGGVSKEQISFNDPRWSVVNFGFVFSVDWEKNITMSEVPAIDTVGCNRWPNNPVILCSPDKILQRLRSSSLGHWTENW